MDGVEAEPIALSDRRENQHGFGHRERHADADPRPGAERDIREAVPRGALLRRKPLRIEALRLAPECRLSMQQPWRDEDGGAGGNAMGPHPTVPQRPAPDRLPPRTQPPPFPHPPCPLTPPDPIL